MIRPIQMNSMTFAGVKNVKPQKIARNVVKVNENAPKGITSPIRGIDNDFDNIIKLALGAVAGTTALTSTYCGTETAAGCSLGSAMV